MRTWILKTEPAECSLEDIRDAPGGAIRWDGIRNYQARNILRQMRAGDRCLVYHSGVKQPALVGWATLLREAYPDPAQFDPASPLYDPASPRAAPRWFCIDIRYRTHFPRPVTLAAIRARADLGAMVRETVKVMEPHAAERGVQLVTQLPDACLHPSADGRALQQALVNLIDNAIKHSPAGETVTVGLECQSNASPLLCNR